MFVYNMKFITLVQSGAGAGAARDTRTRTLTDLPRELRLCILEYTDLITPWREVSWCRQYRHYRVYRPSWWMIPSFVSSILL